MKIASSEMQLQSQHQSITEQVKQERLRISSGERRNRAPDGSVNAEPLTKMRQDAADLSRAAVASQPKKAVAAVSTDEDEMSMSNEDKLKLSLLTRMIESLTGKKLKLAPPGEFSETMEKARTKADATAAELNEINSGNAQGGGVSLQYDSYERHYESESTRFSAQGQVVTTDGKTIDIAVELNMSREFLREQRISVSTGQPQQMQDPLVVNFGGTAAELTDTRFSFDIDSDGRSEQIAFVSPNSGFLALDRNKDGKINDGGELFGAASGDGFAELAAYDEDANGWIDENDSIYQNLRIWSKTADGQDQLVALGERGVGAVYLGKVTTPFALKDQDNDLLGQVRSSSIFLSDSGTAGTVQQIDLAV